MLGTENPADLFTKHSLTRERMMKLVRLFNYEFRGVRAESAPLLRKKVPKEKVCTVNENEEEHAPIM